MKKRELFSDDDFKEAFNKIKDEISKKQVDLGENKLEEFNIDEAIEYVFNFIKTLPTFWEEAHYEKQIKLQGLIFPEKPSYDYSKFQTPRLSPLLATKKELALANSPLVVPRGIEPLFSG